MPDPRGPLERLGHPSPSSGVSVWHNVVVHIRIEETRLEPGELRCELDEGCGSIVSFVGITRPEEDGVRVERLEFDAWEDALPGVLHSLAEQAIEEFGVRSIVIAHRIGAVPAGEPIVCIHVGSTHRKQGFSACSWLITELKNQAPLWKKEVREDGTIWKSGLG
jgi:molybdopterin synthase catalytic subunit